MKLFGFLRKRKCEHDEYCPIYLSYVDKYGEKSPEVKMCKNSNKQYCIKYRLLGETEWKKMPTKKKLKAIREMGLIEFIDKK